MLLKVSILNPSNSFERRVGNVHRSGNFCDFNFSLVGSEEISKVFFL